MSSRYITTTLPYVNADPHLGHALEFVEADCLARASRLAGDDVFLNIGTDEHGAKVAQKAEAEGKNPQEYADEYAARFKTFADRLDISYDSFIRTTNPVHIRAAQEFWTRCAAAGDIYKAEHEIKYCVGCELEKTDSELVDGCCPLHPNLKIEIRKEENYYFRFSKYQDALLEQYKNQKDFVVPAERMHEIATFVAAGLKDFSISRRKEKLSWGVPVPGDSSQIMYVWVEALANYLYPKKYWPADIHVIGKDILRFHAVLWPAMLLSAGEKLPKKILVHGFVLSGDRKMSKTLGNVVDPFDLIKRYGADALRYYLLREITPFEDGDITEEKFKEAYNANLANGLGNLVSRVMKMAEQFDGLEILEINEVSLDGIRSFMDKLELNKALDYIWDLISQADSYIQEEQPFKVVKEDKKKAKAILQVLVSSLNRIAFLLSLFLPEASEKIVKAIKVNKMPETLFPRKD